MNVALQVPVKTVKDFANTLKQNNVDSGFIVTNKDGGVVYSHDVFKELKHLVTSSSSFDKHEGVFFKLDKFSNCLFVVFVHKTVRGNAQGGTRMLSYNSVADLVEDGLRLSRAMTDKNAVANLWWGGGKSIICPLNKESVTSQERRKVVFQNFGKFVAKLNGVYVAAEDMNTTPEDMRTILSVNRFVTCLPTSVGGSANPSSWTAKGVFNAMLAVVKHHENKDSLKDKVVLVQGVGNVGKHLVNLLVENEAVVKVVDANKEACKVLSSYSNVTVLSDAVNVYAEPCDIFAPCAVGGVLNVKTIKNLKAKYVVGAANNQLLNPKTDSHLLAEKGVVYLPDFFVNRMGIVNCANEQYGRLEVNLLKATEQVYKDTLSLLSLAEQNNLTPQVVAEKIANKQSSVPNPIWGHRGQKLIEEVVQSW